MVDYHNKSIHIVIALNHQGIVLEEDNYSLTVYSYLSRDVLEVSVRLLAKWMYSSR